MQSTLAHLDELMPTALCGSVVRTTGTSASVAGLPAPVGAVVEIERLGDSSLTAEVVGFDGGLSIIYPHETLAGVRHGNRVRLTRTKPQLAVGNELLGRVINAAGRPIDHHAPPRLPDRTLLERRPPSPLDRSRISMPLSTGVRAIDGLVTCGRGQRLGIFAGSGVGKSTLLGMMARYSVADVIVIGLIGERGREVREFIERDLGPEGLARSVVIVATSDESALMRRRAAFAATAVAEFFRDQGRDVLLLVDSITRLAQAQREIGLAAGEPPTTRGFPPSVFSLLPRLVERAGCAQRGSVTAFYSVLVEGDDPNEPVADAMRGLLDGHAWLSRKLATRNHYPAIDVLESLSRLMPDLTTPEHRDHAGTVRELLAAYRDHEDLISIGAYRRGAQRAVDLAIDMIDEINAMLKQPVTEASSVEQAAAALAQLQAACIQKARAATKT